MESFLKYMVKKRFWRFVGSAIPDHPGNVYLKETYRRAIEEATVNMLLTWSLPNTY
jgi:hypothetical protein